MEQIYGHKPIVDRLLLYMGTNILSYITKEPNRHIALHMNNEEEDMNKKLNNIRYVKLNQRCLDISCYNNTSLNLEKLLILDLNNYMHHIPNKLVNLTDLHISCIKNNDLSHLNLPKLKKLVFYTHKENIEYYKIGYNPMLDISFNWSNDDYNILNNNIQKFEYTYKLPESLPNLEEIIVKPGLIKTYYTKSYFLNCPEDLTNYNFPKLRKIKNIINQIPKKLPSVEYISFNNFFNYNINHIQMPNIKQLILSECSNIGELPFNIYLKNLEKLKLSNGYSECLIQCEFPNLKELDLGGNFDNDYSFINYRDISNNNINIKNITDIDYIVNRGIDNSCDIEFEYSKSIHRIFCRIYDNEWCDIETENFLTTERNIITYGFDAGFNKYLPGNLSKIKFLKLPTYYNQKIDYIKFDNLEQLYINPYFKHSLPLSLPKLKSLYINNNYNCSMCNILMPNIDIIIFSIEINKISSQASVSKFDNYLPSTLNKKTIIQIGTHQIYYEDLIEYNKQCDTKNYNNNFNYLCVNDYYFSVIKHKK